MPRRTLAFAALLAASLTASACDEKLSDLTGPTPNLTPTFASIQREIFDQQDSSGRSACVQCHAPGLPAANFSRLVLTSGSSYAALVGTPSSGKAGAVRVVPGDPANSYLIQKLRGTPGIAGLRMPRNSGPFLTEGQIQVIERWIAIGAPNN